MPEWLDRLFSRQIQQAVARQVSERVSEAVKVLDDQYWDPIGGGYATRTLDLVWSERRAMIEECLELWRTNPLAYRIVSLMTDYVVGSGITVRSEHPAIQAYIRGIWGLEQNDMGQRLYRWCEELTRCGDLFIVINTGQASGMPIFRELPALAVDQIELDAEDRERELRFHELTNTTEGRWWIGVDHPLADEFDQVVLHVAVNRPVGSARGVSDLWPVAKWLTRYSAFLEDRVRVQRYKASFLWHCKITNPQPGELEAKRAQYTRTPPSGSILVTDANEEWDAVNPQIGAFEAEADGHQLRLYIASGAGIPLHFLSEGESATRATAREMGNPTYRQYRHRQQLFGDMLLKLVRACVYRAGIFMVGADLRLSVEVEDLTKEDSVTLSLALSQAVDALVQMRAEGWIDDERAASMALRFADETMQPDDIAKMLQNTKAKEGQDARKETSGEGDAGVG